jgi:hypothetical protein
VGVLMLTAWETSMRPTQKKARTISSIEKLEKAATAALAGPRASEFRQLERQLARAVLCLLKENRRLTSSSEQLLLVRREAAKQRSQLLMQLSDCQVKLARQERQQQQRKPRPKA